MDLPIFPLNGAVLFPGTSLPLNIFENRYIEMINYSLARDRFIGMIQSNQNSELYNIGCVGKINSFNETNDGRYLISLHGMYKFKVIKELEAQYNFRIVNADPLENDENEDVFSNDQKASLIEKYNNYIKITGINIDMGEIKKIDVSQIIKFISMVSPFKDIDKQILLESKDIVECYHKLLSIIELEIIGDFGNKTIN